MSTREERVRKRLNDMPAIYRATYLKAINRESMAAAVKAFCSECYQWQREEVKQCVSVNCPLWRYRPYVKKSKMPKIAGLSPSESTNSENTEDSSNG